MYFRARIISTRHVWRRGTKKHDSLEGGGEGEDNECGDRSGNVLQREGGQLVT